MLPGASMLASKPIGWKCQRMSWQAFGKVILLTLSIRCIEQFL